MARILIVVVVVVLLALGVYGALAALGFASIPPFAAGLFGLSSETGSVTDPEDRITGTVAFIPLEHATITVFRKNRVYRHMLVRVTLQVHGRDNINKVKDALAELQGIVVLELGSYANLQIEESGEINVENIKKRMVRVIDNRLGKNTVHDVLIGELFLRRPR